MQRVYICCKQLLVCFLLAACSQTSSRLANTVFLAWKVLKYFVQFEVSGVGSGCI